MEAATEGKPTFMTLRCEVQESKDWSASRKPCFWHGLGRSPALSLIDQLGRLCNLLSSTCLFLKWSVGGSWGAVPDLTSPFFFFLAVITGQMALTYAASS